jgi:acyl-coenzyme A synthetase/AMP-(fatty) acid ligase
MTVNPDNTPLRQKYLLDHSDWSMKISTTGIEYREGGDHGDERIFAYTSGTTGDSKFYSFNQAQIDHCVDHMIRSYDITANDRYVGVMPLWHAHGQAFYWLAQRIGCESHFLPISAIRDLPDFAPTFVSAIPDILKTISQLKLDDLRFVRSASSAMPDWLFKGLKESFGVPVIEAFGMTEAYSHCFTNPLHGEQRMGTVGLPDGIRATIKDGHLMIQGPSVVTNDWFDTGDLADQDSAGYYRILGRSVDQLNIKGKKFNPSSLESQLLKNLPSLKECVIFGDHELNCLYVGECTDQDIVKFLRDLDTHLRPVLLKQVDEIPLKYPGKISRSYLKNLFDCK